MTRKQIASYHHTTPSTRYSKWQENEECPHAFKGNGKFRILDGISISSSLSHPLQDQRDPGELWAPCIHHIHPIDNFPNYPNAKELSHAILSNRVNQATITKWTLDR